MEYMSVPLLRFHLFPVRREQKALHELCARDSLRACVCVSRLYMHVYISVTSLSAFAISPSHSHSFNQVWDTERARHCHLSTSAAQPYLMTTNRTIWTTSAYGPTVYTLVHSHAHVYTHHFPLCAQPFVYMHMHACTYSLIHKNHMQTGSSREHNVTKSDRVLLTNKHYCMQRACPHKFTPPTYASLHLDY